LDNSSWEFEYRPVLGVAWFLQSLLLYSVAYVLAAGGQAIHVRMPTLPVVVCVGAIAQAMEVLALTMGFEQILDAPANGLGGAVPQTIAFYAGCVAYQNRWLDTLLELKTDRKATYQLGFVPLWYLPSLALCTRPVVFA